VARFVGENNAWSGTVRAGGEGLVEIEIPGGRRVRSAAALPLATGAAVELFIRPEAFLIQPDPGLPQLNRFPVMVKALLFDGANSRLLAAPPDESRELLIALPQTRQYDHIRAGDRVEVGWHEQSGICFPAG
jgi:spermidine/putrescine transport system ATP-binding protein